MPARLPRIAGRYLDLAPLDALRAEEHAAGGAELAELPAGIDALKHSRNEGALQVRARRQRSNLKHRAVHVAHDVPAQFLGRL